jgi:hypothetical protein
MFFFHVPVWLTWVIVFFLVPSSVLHAKVPLWTWISVVLLIDVAHVWSTIYRTYLDKEAFQRNRDLLLGIPLAVFLCGFLVASVSDDLFWTVLAYIAVFHFIKQQYGITALYQGRMFGHLKTAPKERKEALQKHLSLLTKIDKWAVYSATVMPVIVWHIYLPKKIWWFSKWDFLPFLTLLRELELNATGALIYQIGSVVFVTFWIGTLVVWLVGHVFVSRTYQLSFPIGKCLWVVATYINWYVGIVYLDSPFAFTLTNVVAHGIPYFGLIFLYSENAWRDRATKRASSVWQTIVSSRALLILGFVVPLVFFAFWEEYLWDLLVRGGEYKAFFNVFLSYPFGKVTDQVWLAFWLAFLSIPQATHYFLDRYIWRPGKRNPHLKQYLQL